MSLNKAYRFTILNNSNVSVTMYPNDVDLVAGTKAHLAGKSMKAAEQLIRKRLMNRIHQTGGEGARLVPVT